MTTATINSRGEIAVPAVVLEALQVEPGDRLEFVELESAQFMVRAVTRSVTELKSLFGTAVTSVSIEDMNRAIAASAAAAAD